MNGFVKTTNGNFPNRNFYSAWKGLTEMNYEVIKFEEEALNDDAFLRSIGDMTPVFAGVTVFDKIIQLKGIDYKKIDTYPPILYPFLNREIVKSTLGDFRKQWDSDEDNRPRLFMKPVEQKKFNGAIMKSILDWIPMANVPPETPVYLCEELHFESEFRVYIHDQEIRSAKHYLGKWDKMIDRSVVEEAIKVFAPEAPCAYALDFGVDVNGRTTLVEFNDATSLGNYGLADLYYAEMLTSRWVEIASHKKS
jgi:hypothetical protein